MSAELVAAWRAISERKALSYLPHEVQKSTPKSCLARPERASDPIEHTDKIAELITSVDSGEDPVIGQL